MSHLTEQDRHMIANLLDAGLSPLAIAHQLKRAHSTITRELRKHRREDEENQKHKKNFCNRRLICHKRSLCKIPPGNCPGRCSQCKLIECRKYCDEYEEEVCMKLARPPFVCNGCPDLKNCRKRKFFYQAVAAEKAYLDLLHECRKGIDVSEAEIRQYNELIRHGGHNGQSLHHIMSAHKDVFQKCPKTLYNYFNQGIFSLPRGEMPRMCMRKPRKVEKIRHKVDPKCRSGRTLADYEKYCLEHPNLPTVQMDSVIGSVGGKVLLTLQFECGMMLAWLRDTNNSQSVIEYFDLLEQKLGLSRFRRMFPIILTDNGSEFSNPTAIEISPITGKRRTRIFYCDPNAAWQKGSIENNHTNLRRILVKGCSFTRLTQQDIDLVLSHLNSYIRKSYDDTPAIERFCALFGKDCLDALNLTVIPPDDIILDPKLLKGKI